MGLVMVCFVIVGLAGCGGNGPTGTGAIEGYVYVPQGDKTAINVSRAAEPPLGYVALYGADVKVEIAGRTWVGKTDTYGHFKVGGLPSGIAKVTITPPLIGGTGLAEFFAFTTTMEVKANTTVSIGSDGNISLISHSADHLEVIINQIDATDFPTVRLYVSVVDPVRNTPIIGIGYGGFEVAVSQSPVTIDAFRQVASNSAPASIGLVLDRSGSMDGQPLEDLKDAAREFVGFLGIDDRAEIISFSNDVVVDCPFTSDKTRLQSAITALQSYDMTALYDGIYRGIEDTAIDSNPRKAVVAMTDGGENWSSYATLDKVIALAKQSGIPVYTIGLQGAGFTRERSSKTVTRARSEQELQQIARQTGGEYFYAPQSSDLMGIYTKITQRQQQQYILTIQDPNPQSTDTRIVRVEVNACSLTGSGSAEYGHKRYDYPVPQVQYEPGSYAGRSFYYNPSSAKPHLGEDIDLAEETPIRAIGDGRIVQYEAHQGYGELCAVIEHNLGQTIHFSLTVGDAKQVDTQYLCSIYGHIRKSQQRGGVELPWKVGDTVKAGQIIGYVNNSSHPDLGSPDPNGDGLEHLHMGIRLTAHPNRWAYYGYEDTTNPYANVKDFAAFSEVIQQLQ